MFEKLTRILEKASTCDWCGKDKLDVTVKTKFMRDYKRFCHLGCMARWGAKHSGLKIEDVKDK